MLPNNLNSYLWQFSNNNNVVEYNGYNTRDGFGSENNDLENFVTKVNGDIAKTLKNEGVITD